MCRGSFHQEPRAYPGSLEDRSYIRASATASCCVQSGCVSIKFHEGIYLLSRVSGSWGPDARCLFGLWGLGSRSELLDEAFEILLQHPKMSARPKGAESDTPESDAYPLSNSPLLDRLRLSPHRARKSLCYFTQR